MSNPVWRITFPIVKAEEREDGRYLIGEASGPEIDLEGERMSPEAIESFSRQVNENQIPYRDTHKPYGAMHDLGYMTRGWINDKFHLGVEVKLDDDNPAAVYIHKKAMDGKQYGMSIAGEVPAGGYTDEFVPQVGKNVRTYKNVLLTEIVNTTRPAWTPSLGTVLAKAIDEAEEAESLTKGDNQSMEDLELRQEQETEAPAEVTEPEVTSQEETTEEAPATEEAAAEDASEAGDGTPASTDEMSDTEFAAQVGSEDSSESAEAPAPDTTETTESATVEAEAGEEAPEAETVERAGRAISATNAKRLLALYTEMTHALTDLGLIEAEDETSTKSVSEDEEENVEKSDESEQQPEEVTVSKTELDELRKQLSEATARIESIEKMPRVELPPVVERVEDTTPQFEDVYKSLTPAERLRLALEVDRSSRRNR